jgi:hypothetical protein
MNEILFAVFILVISAIGSWSFQVKKTKTGKNGC